MITLLNDFIEFGKQPIFIYNQAFKMFFVYKSFFLYTYVCIVLTIIIDILSAPQMKLNKWHEFPAAN